MTTPGKDRVHMSALHLGSNGSQTRPIEGYSSEHDAGADLFQASGVGSAATPRHEGLPTSTNHIRVIHPGEEGKALGKPAKRELLTWKDYCIVITCLLSAAGAVVSVADEMVAVRIGQQYQLVILGFCLSVMAYCAEKHVLYLLVSIETSSHGKSGKPTTLQDLDAILCCDPLSDFTSLRYRQVLLGIIALPLGLSAAYKTFQGGQSSWEITRGAMDFGLTGAPGTQHIGFGVSLFVNATLPWFSDPGFDRHYGFNMYVRDNQTTAMLDAPLPSALRQIQFDLSDGESCQIEATVRAVVCTVDPELSEEQKMERNSAYSIRNNGGGDHRANQQFVYTSDQQLGIMIDNTDDSTRFWMSWWSVPLGQTFGSEVRQYSLTRKMARGTWTVTPNSVSLTRSTILEDDASDLNRTLQNNILAIPMLFTPSLTEYDYKFRDQGYSRHQDNAKYRNNIHNDATILASVVWARMTALIGPEIGNEESTNPSYQVDFTSQTTRITLQRHWGLFLVLGVQPAIMLTAIAVRLARYKSSPVSQDFGLVSLLAAADPVTLAMLDGAGYSGKLKRPLPVTFHTEEDPFQKSEDDASSLKRNTNSPADHKMVTLVFGEGGRNSPVRRRIVYT